MNHYQTISIIAILYGNIDHGHGSIDEYTTCGKAIRDARNFRLIPHIPCDLKKDPWCASAGSQYPMDAMKRFVYENQGLMKRMYGEQRHISVMRSELYSEMSNTVPTDQLNRHLKEHKWNSFKRSGKKRRMESKRTREQKRQRDNSERAVRISADEDIFNQHNPQSVTKTKMKGSTSVPTSSTLRKSNTTITPTDQTVTLNLNTESYNITSSSFEHLTTDIVTDFPEVTMTNDFEEDSYTTIEEQFDTEEIPPLDAYEWEESSDPEVSSYAYVTSELTSSSPPERENNRVLTPESFSTFSTSYYGDGYDEHIKGTDEVDAETSEDIRKTPLKSESPTISNNMASASLLESDQNTESIKHKITEALGSQVKIQVNTGSQRSDIKLDDEDEATVTDEEQEPLSNRSSPDDDHPVGSSSSDARKPVNHGENIHKENNNSQEPIYVFNHRKTPPKAEPHKTYSQFTSQKISDSKRNTYSSAVIMESKQETVQHIPARPPHNHLPPTGPAIQKPPIKHPVGVNACPIKEEWVAPYWANNTNGEIRALLNFYPFEQYVHYERCMKEHHQMYCRRGCRCEQQYRLHRLLALDPNNECRGIFSDWFRFPSCCVCKCYDLSHHVLTMRKSRVHEDYYDDNEEFYEDDYDVPDELDYPDHLESEESMEVRGWGNGHYRRSFTPKASVKPQISPRRSPRPRSHIAPPSNVLLPPPLKVTKKPSRMSNSFIQGRGLKSGIEISDKLLSSVTPGTVDSYARPYPPSARGKGRSLERAPRSTKSKLKK